MGTTRQGIWGPSEICSPLTAGVGESSLKNNVAHAFLQCDGSVTVKQRCTKVPYVTLREARRKAGNRKKKPAGLVAMGAGALVAYKCKICSAYHTGHR